MNKLSSAFWLLLSACWFSAFLFLGSTVGGVQWLVHTGMGRPAAMNMLMAILCLLGAVRLFGSKPLPMALIVVASVVTAVHLFNAIGTYLIYETNGRILVAQTAVMFPFRMLSAVLPTNSIFTSQPFTSHLLGNAVFLALPLFSLAVILVSLRKPVVKQANRGQGE